MVSPDNEHAPEQLIEEAAPEGPVKRGGLGRTLGKTFGSLLLLTALAGAGGYAVIAFQDQDPRLKTAAKTLEDAIAKAREQAQSFTEAHVPSISGKITTPARRMVPVEEKPREDSAGSEPTTATPPQLDAETVQKAQREAEEAVKRAEAEAQEKAQADAAAKEAEEKARTEAEAAEKRAAEEKLARESAEAAEREKAAAQPKTAQPAASATISEELSARELATGLEGRIDELGDEIKALRERLDAPKNETRAAPETVEKPAPTPDSGAAQIVVAYTLQRQLESGKPFGDELAALTRLGADSTTLDALRPLAEGAPTAAKLQSEFAGLAKKIHAPASGHAEDLTEQLSKLVKVRPPGQAATTDNSVEGIIARIDAALTRSDLVAAETALASLPESARSELRSFADKLHARAEADKAADALVHGAIMALGKTSDKN